MHRESCVGGQVIGRYTRINAQRDIDSLYNLTLKRTSYTETATTVYVAVVATFWPYSAYPYRSSRPLDWNKPAVEPR